MRFIGNAVNVPEVCTITLTGDWAGGDTATFTINHNDLVVTAGSGVTTSDLMATLIGACWNSDTRINTSQGSCNAGGKSIGEFAEIICTVSGSVLTFTTRQDTDAGKPFKAYLTHSEVTAGSGVLGAVTTVQSATGKNWWNNADNWDGNTAPTNGAAVELSNCSVPIKWGFPIFGDDVRLTTLEQYKSFTGTIGLPAINSDNANFSLPSYSEYRPLGPVFTDHSDHGDSRWTFGIGDGTGSSFQNWTYSTTGAGTCDVRIFDTTSQSSNSAGQSDLNITSGSKCSLTALKGRVGLNGGFSSIKVGFQGSQPSDVTLIHAATDQNCDYEIAGGTVTVRDGTGDQDITIVMYAGAVKLQNFSAGTLAITVDGGVLSYDSNNLIDSLSIGDGAVVDFKTDLRAVTMTDATLNGGSKLDDPFKRLTYSNPVSTPDGIENVTWIAGPGRHFAVT